jgi:glutathione S-transferase
MKLFTMPGACSMASHIALIWTGLPFELGVLDHDSVHGSAFARINPKMSVPALVLDDGTVITESLAVLFYIAELNRAARLGASNHDALAWAKLNETMSELVSEVHKAYAPIFVPGRYVTDEAARGSVKQAAYILLDQKFDRLDALMSDGRQWLALGHRSVADAYLYLMCSWKDSTPTPLSHFPHLAAHAARMKADPGVQRAQREQAGGSDVQAAVCAITEAPEHSHAELSEPR